MDEKQTALVLSQIGSIIADDIERKFKAHRRAMLQIAGLPDDASDVEVASVLDFDKFTQLLVGMPLDKQTTSRLDGLALAEQDLKVLLSEWRYGIVSTLCLDGVRYRHRS